MALRYYNHGDMLFNCRCSPCSVSVRLWRCLSYPSSTLATIVQMAAFPRPGRTRPHDSRHAKWAGDNDPIDAIEIGTQIISIGSVVRASKSWAALP